MKQDIFNLFLWLTTVLMIIIIISIIINKINDLSKQITKNNISHLCDKNKSTEPFEPYNDSYTNGFFVKNVLCSNLDVSKDLNITGKDNIKINGTEIFKLIYPVGSIYISTNSTSPATLFGGTWEQIKDRFLYTASSDSTKTGGSSTATLSIENMPSHNHTFNGKLMEGGMSNAGESGWIRKEGAGYSWGVFKTLYDELHPWAIGHYGKWEWGGAYGFKFEATPSGTISNTGEGKSFSIMPPYYKVYCWRRTAL